MARNHTVVSANHPVVDEEGNFTGEEEQQMYYLLHWGLTYTILTDHNQNHPVSFTVGICQHIKTGEIFSFNPTDLTVIGTERV